MDDKESNPFTVYGAFYHRNCTSMNTLINLLMQSQQWHKTGLIADLADRGLSLQISGGVAKVA